MSVQRLPSGRWRAQVWDPELEVKHSVTKLLTPDELERLGADAKGTFASRDDAISARALGRRKLEERRDNVTIAEFREVFLTDPVFSGHWADSTRAHRRERTQQLVDEYGEMLIKDFGAKTMARFLWRGKRRGRRSGSPIAQVPVYRVMWAAAMSPAAGCLVETNVWETVRMPRSRGNRDKQPPTVEQMATLLRTADELTPPSFADYLALATVTAMRPCELDALKWEAIDWENEEIHVDRQWNVKTRTYSLPKTGRRTIALIDGAKAILRRAECYREDGIPWVFPTLTGHHYTPSTRSPHWTRVRVAAGVPEKTLYLCTRHYFAWFAYVILGLDARIVAAQLGHRDGGRLIESTYGHPDHDRRLRDLRAAFREVPIIGAGPADDDGPIAPVLRLVPSPTHEPELIGAA